MSETRSDPIGTLRAGVAAAAAELGGEGTAAALTFERPPRADFGDFSTNAALLLAPTLGRGPREVAADLGDLVLARVGDDLDRVDIAGPGFLNLFLDDRWFRTATASLNEAGAGFGSGFAAHRSRRTLLEFVSANPTGPITVAAARHAAYGDSLGRILEFGGHTVEREYYVNDAGGQIRLFGDSIAARMEGGTIPEGGYQGEYVVELARALAGEGVEADDPAALARRGVEMMREQIERSLAGFRVHFDHWSSERALHDAGKLEAAVELIRDSGYAYERDGAVWMRTTDFGDDKDRVMVRADGEPTYFTADIAYHRDKLDRDAELMLDVLGADHHGYVPRLKAIVAALGAPPDVFEVQIMQLVNLLEGGERAKMSKRRGEFTTLDDLLADIGVDAARFFLVQRSHDTPLDLDLDLARTRSNDNPVYYVQYAHARICSLISKAAGKPAGEPDAEAANTDGLEPSEKALICRLLELPAQLERAELRREPHAVAAYAREVAADFHGFYRDCPVVKAPESVRSERLALCAATRSVIATSLGLLGIEAPEAM